MADRFARQRLIPSWNQEELRDASVAVVGKDLLGAACALGLAALGLEVIWVGEPRPETEPMVRWLLAEPPPRDGPRIVDYPLDVEGGELDWIFAPRPPRVVIATAEGRAGALVQEYCRRARILRFLTATTRHGGWMGTRLLPGPESGDQDQDRDPATALLIAGLLIDEVRAEIAPLAFDHPRRAMGALRLEPPPRPGPGPVLLIGAGGIGVYAACLICLLNIDLVVVDGDTVDVTNLNRQALYREADAAQQRAKAEALRSALGQLCPGARVTALNERVEVVADFAAALARRGIVPAAICSAVDSGASRLLIQELGIALRCLVVQAATDLAAADVFVQASNGPSLDEQMFGALTAATRREEADQARGHCAVNPSYVAPSMVAGALMVYRLCQALADPEQGWPPLRWRSGGKPRATETRHDFLRTLD